MSSTTHSIFIQASNSSNSDQYIFMRCQFPSFERYTCGVVRHSQYCYLCLALQCMRSSFCNNNVSLHITPYQWHVIVFTYTDNCWYYCCCWCCCLHPIRSPHKKTTTNWICWFIKTHMFVGFVSMWTSSHIPTHCFMENRLSFIQLSIEECRRKRKITVENVYIRNCNFDIMYNILFPSFVCFSCIFAEEK